MLAYASDERKIEPLQIEPGESSTRQLANKQQLTLSDALQKLRGFVVAGAAVLLLLFILVIYFATSSNSPATLGTPGNTYAYDEASVDGELQRLENGPAFHHEKHTWWAHLQQDICSTANADVEGGDISNYQGPRVWKWKENYGTDEADPFSLPYTDVSDNTESIPGFEDIEKMGLIPENAVLLDLGGGKYDSTTNWMNEKRADVTMLVADPFNRNKEDNVKVQKEIEEKGGADIVTSISVLNVLKEQAHQAYHVWLVKETLKPGGLAIFKLWAGLWPIRGTRKQTASGHISGDAEKDKDVIQFQNNAFSDAYKPLIAKVFGEDAVFADSSMNLIVARREKLKE